MDDIRTLKSEVERIRHHMDLQKKATEENTQLLVDIKNILVGNDLSKGGLVRKFDEMENEIEDLRTFKGEVNVYLKQAKFVIGGLILAIISIGVKIFSR